MATSLRLPLVAAMVLLASAHVLGRNTPTVALVPTETATVSAGAHTHRVGLGLLSQGGAEADGDYRCSLFREPSCGRVSVVCAGCCHKVDCAASR